MSDTTATDPETGVVHKLAGETTACGKNARGWSTAVTQLQLLGLVLFCEDCAA